MYSTYAKTEATKTGQMVKRQHRSNTRGGGGGGEARTAKRKRKYTWSGPVFQNCTCDLMAAAEGKRNRGEE